MCDQCLSRGDALISFESLLMDPCLMTSFKPVAAAIDGLSIVWYVNVPVLDGTNFFVSIVRRFNFLWWKHSCFHLLLNLYNEYSCYHSNKWHNCCNEYNANNVYDTFLNGITLKIVMCPASIGTIPWPTSWTWSDSHRLNPACGRQIRPGRLCADGAG